MQTSTSTGRLDAEQKQPLKGGEITIAQRLELFNERSLVWENDVKIVYLFDYAKESGRGEIINRHVLKKLKDGGHWNAMKHPLVLNFVNEKLLSCTLFYSLHVITYFFFLFLLYSFIEGRPTVGKNLLVTAIILFSVFFLLVKAALKLQYGVRHVSFWFIVSYIFTICTYAITLFYVWSFYLFNFDDYNEEVKRTISWFLPIVAIISSWINCLYVLRKSPCGAYILMMSRILLSFLNTTIIWIPTLFCFAFAFQLVMRDSGTLPWADATNSQNGTSIFMAMFQSFTKTTAMMIGEVEANDILERRAWIANFLLILFEIITVILLMNLMISLAVGDVNELRMSAEERLLKIKVNFCIEALHLSEQVTLLDGLPCITVLHRSLTNNVLVISKNSDRVFSQRMSTISAESLIRSWRRQGNFEISEGRYFDKINPVHPKESTKTYDFIISTSGLRLRKEALTNKASLMDIQGCTLRLVEASPSGIRTIDDEDLSRGLNTINDEEGLWRKYQRWLIGLNWKALLAL